MRTPLRSVRCSLSIFTLTLLCRAVTTAAEQGSGAPERTVTERGAHHRTWQRDNFITAADGTQINQPKRVIELATGLHYRENDEWKESRDEIEIVVDGAAATKGQHKVHLNGNINSSGAITITMPDGRTLRAHPLCLAFTDPATGQSAIIAELQNSTGILVPPNQVVYPGAFSGNGVLADIRVTYTKGGFESDVIVRNQLPAPANWNFNEETVLLEVWHEFPEAPEPGKILRVLGSLPDEELNFGSMRIGRGGAFALDAPLNRMSAVPVGKTWTTVGNPARTYLIESVPYRAIKAELEQLPPLQAANNPAPARIPEILASREVGLVKLVPPKERDATPVRMALDIKAIDLRKGLVLDYVILGGETNAYRLKADTTYYISESMNFLNDVVFEPTVVKVNCEGDYLVQTWQNVTLETDDYHPVIFTSRNDKTVGEDVSTNTASLNYYGALSNTRADLEFKHLRISYAKYGLHTFSMKVRHAQFVRCEFGLYTEYTDGNGSGGFVDNVLFYDVTKAFGGGFFHTVARHVTVNRANYLTTDWAAGSPPDSTLKITNSLFVNVTNSTSTVVAISTNFTAIASDSDLQTVGAGAHYLAVSSPYRQIGTTNLPSSLLADLRLRTTYPPIVLTSNLITTNFVMVPRVPRSTNLPDLGYHYAALDYVYGSNVLTNASLTILGGTALGTFTPNTNSQGLMLHGNSTMTTRGDPTNPVRIVRYNMVQEQASAAWSSVSPGASIRTYTTTITPSPTAQFSFTDWSQPVNDSWHFVSHGNNLGPFYFDNCTFSGGRLNSFAAAFALTNCLLLRVDGYFADDTATQLANFYNNSFYGGTSTFSVTGFSPAWNFFNNAFCTTNITANHSPNHSHNAYLSGASRIGSYASNDLITNIVFEVGPLGRYYLTNTSPLLNAGSMNATNAGLYHFTTTTNQFKETNSTVDLGFHYVALGAGGTALDYDSDGLPDYWEDSNGNGSYDPSLSETDWRTPGFITIGNESAVVTPTNAAWSYQVNVRPGYGEIVSNNPPIFTWFYATGVLSGGDMLGPGWPQNVNEWTNAFNFQIATNAAFTGTLAADVTIPYNWYNALASIPTNAGRTIYWRVKYIREGVPYWTNAYQFTISATAMNWDRSLLGNSTYLTTNSVHPFFCFRAGQQADIWQWIQTNNATDFQRLTNTATTATNASYFQSSVEWFTNSGSLNPTFAVPGFGVGTRMNEVGSVLLLWAISGEARWTNESMTGWLITNANHLANWYSHPSNNWWAVDYGNPAGDPQTVRLLCASYDWMYHRLGSDSGTFEGRTRTNLLHALRLTSRFYSHNAFTVGFPYATGGLIIAYDQQYPVPQAIPPYGIVTNENVSWDNHPKIGTSHKSVMTAISFPIFLVAQADDAEVRRAFEWSAHYALAKTSPYMGYAAHHIGPYGYVDANIYARSLTSGMLLFDQMYPQINVWRNDFGQRFPEWYSRMHPYRKRMYHGAFGDGAPFGYSGYVLGLDTRGADIAAFGRSGEMRQAYELNSEFRADFDDASSKWEQLALRWHFRVPPPLVTNTQSKVYPEDGYALASTFSPSEYFAYTNGVGFALRASPRYSAQGHNIPASLAPDMWAYGTQLTDGGGSGLDAFSAEASGSPGLLVNGLGEGDVNIGTLYGNSQRTPFNASILNFTNSGTNFVYVCADGTPMFQTYYHPLSNLVTRVRRHMLFVRSRYWVIADEFNASSPATFMLRWQVPWVFQYRTNSSALANETAFSGNRYGSNSLVMLGTTGFTYTAGNYADSAVPNPPRVPVHVLFANTNGSVGFFNSSGNAALTGATNAIATGNTNDTLNPFVAGGTTYSTFSPSRAVGMWITNTVTATNFLFVWAIVPVEPGKSAPTFQRLDNATLAVTYDGVTETNSFGTNYTGAYTYRIETTVNH